MGVGVGGCLQELRRSRGRTLTDLATALDVAHSTLQRWEAGTRGIGGADLIRVLDALGATEQEREEVRRVLVPPAEHGVPVLATDSDGCLTPSGSAGGDGGTPSEDEAQPAPAVVSCGRCGGTGQVAGDDCGACESTGRVVAA